MTKSTENKTDRKKLFTTQVVGSTVIWHRTDTGAEVTRIDTAELGEGIMAQLVVYGTKQVCADVVAGESTPDKKCAGVARAVDALRAGAWPRRESTASHDATIAVMVARMGITAEAARAMLGLDDIA